MPLRRICMICSRHFGDSGSEEDHGDTHGVCPDCWPKVESEYNAPTKPKKKIDRDLQTFIENYAEYMRKQREDEEK